MSEIKFFHDERILSPINAHMHAKYLKQRRSIYGEDKKKKRTTRGTKLSSMPARKRETKSGESSKRGRRMAEERRRRNYGRKYFYTLIIIHLVIIYAHALHYKHHIKMTKKNFYFNKYEQDMKLEFGL